MGSIDYQVMLHPTSESKHSGGKSFDDIDLMAHEILNAWSEIRRDSSIHNDTYSIPLVFDSEKEIFQILLGLDWQDSHVFVSLRFAYCNPKSIFESFCSVIEWLMANYQMQCQLMRRGNEGSGNVDVAVVNFPNQIRGTLIPSMELMRNNWMLLPGATEAKLLPSEALHRFYQVR